MIVEDWVGHTPGQVGHSQLVVDILQALDIDLDIDFENKASGHMIALVL